jgi:hypothetical protein
VKVPINVDDVMREIEDEVRRARRKRLLAQGAAAEYADPAIYATVDGILRRAVEMRDHDALLLPELAGGEDGSRLTTHLRFSSHRPVLGPMLVFAKRRLLLPATRWLYEFSLHNFRRQDRLNRVLFACIEELAIENAKLRQEIAGLHNHRIAGVQNDRIAGLQDGRIAGSGSHSEHDK